MLIDLAEDHNLYGIIDWVNVATDLDSGMTNIQCCDRWNKLKFQGKVSIDEAVYMSTWYTPNLSYDYNDDVEMAYNIKRKKASGEWIRWSLEMV